MMTPWNLTCGGSDLDRGWSVRPVEDGIVVAGWTASYGRGKADDWLLMFDRQGNELENRTYGGPGNDRFLAMESLHHGYILVGYTTSYGVSFTDLWLVRTDRQGNELWNRTYGGNGIEATLAIPVLGLGPVEAALTVGHVQRRATYVGLGPFLVGRA